MRKIKIIYADRRLELHRELMNEYIAYKDDKITEQEYLLRVKPLDIAIGEIEMAILRDTLALKESFLPHTLKPKC